MGKEGISKKDFANHVKGVSFAFNKVKSELNDHLDTINQNTSEMNSMQQYIVELESKIEKLSERIDMLMTANSFDSSYEFNETLSLREQEVFIALYTADAKKSAIQIAQYLGLTDELIHNYMYKLISKGIPVQKKFSDDSGELHYILDPHFKDLQARKNLVEINESVLQEMNVKDTSRLN